MKSKGTYEQFCIWQKIHRERIWTGSFWQKHRAFSGRFHITMNDGEVERVVRFVKDLKNVKFMRVLPYHNYAKRKYECLGQSYPLPHVTAPEKSNIEAVAQKMRDHGLKNVVLYWPHTWAARPSFRTGAWSAPWPTCWSATPPRATASLLRICWARHRCRWQARRKLFQSPLRASLQIGIKMLSLT